MSGPAKDHGPDQSRIDLEAAEWQVRGGERALTREEERMLAQWLARDVRHVQAFEAIGRVRASASRLAHLTYLLPKADAGPLPFAPNAVPPPVRWRGFVGFGTAATLSVLTISLLSILNQPIPTPAPALPHYETAVGENRTVRLEDGSTLMIGARSKVQIVFSPAERRVRLLEGEAYFDVVHLPDRAFVVEADGTVIRDIGTKFDVNRADTNVQVAVLEGEVEVQAAATPALGEAPPTVVRAGQKVNAVWRKGPDVGHVMALLAPVDFPKEAADNSWREGHLVYENARLGELVADMNRYYAPGISLSRDAADIRITASLRTTEIGPFLQSLESALPVAVVKAASGGFSIDVSSAQRAVLSP